MRNTSTQVIQEACNQIANEVATIRRFVTGASACLPTIYDSFTKGRITISEMNPFHLLNAARKADGPMRVALCAEIGERYLAEKV
jgi:hypothetical protein